MGDLILFPQLRSVGKARQVAATWLKHVPGKQRDAYWSSMTEQFRSAALRLGFDDDEINRQLLDFRLPVECEILAIHQREEDLVLDLASRLVADHTHLDDNPGAA